MTLKDLQHKRRYLELFGHKFKSGMNDKREVPAGIVHPAEILSELPEMTAEQEKMFYQRLEDRLDKWRNAANATVNPFLSRPLFVKKSND